jgi:CRISPR/Cas system-associated exonuclease Cas4 (RecB family)
MTREIRPSSGPKLAACPVFVGSEGASPAAERGTLLDAAVRGAVQCDYEVYEQLSPEDQRAAEWGRNELLNLSAGYPVETREEYLAMAVPGLSTLGTADAICKVRGWVADIKTGQARSYREQMAAYALACMEDHFATNWTAHVLYIDQKMRRTYEFTREDAERITAAWIEKAKSREAQPTPSEYCDWCANKSTCSALVRQSEEALLAIRSDRSLDEIRAEIAADPVSLSVFTANWKAAEKHLAEPLIELLKTRLSDGEEIPGWKVTSSAGREFVEAEAIAKAATNVSKETLILALGGKMSAKNFRQFCADSGVEVDETAIRAGAPITTLRQTKTK